MCSCKVPYSVECLLGDHRNKGLADINQTVYEWLIGHMELQR